jgi:hypothetical protein
VRIRKMAAACSVAIATGLLAVAAGTGLGSPAHAATTPPTVPASGAFSFTTANGILPTWSSDDIVLVGVSPGSVVTAASNLSARVSMPIVAKTGSANAAAGGFRFYNSDTGASVRCSTPTIDTRARVVDCVLPTGKNSQILRISSIGRRSVVTGGSTVTWVYRKIVLRINGQAAADMLNDALDTTAFSPYVTVGIGDLVVTRDL